jgi:hypothetical protein
MRCGSAPGAASALGRLGYYRRSLQQFENLGWRQRRERFVSLLAFASFAYAVVEVAVVL